MKTLRINNKEYQFVGSAEECWITNILTSIGEMRVEIYTNEIDAEHLKNVIDFALQDNFAGILNRGRSLLTSLSAEFWGPEIDDAEFLSPDISIGLYHDLKTVDFQINFQMRSAKDNFDDLANWKVDIKNKKIIGVRREEC